MAQDAFKLSFFLLLLKTWQVSTYFDGLLGESDVFENPSCTEVDLASDSCECNRFHAECLTSTCKLCKCRKKTRIYRSDVRKCLSDIKARDPCK